MIRLTGNRLARTGLAKLTAIWLPAVGQAVAGLAGNRLVLTELAELTAIRLAASRLARAGLAELSVI